MKLSEIEKQMNVLNSEVDVLTTKANKLANEWRTLSRERTEKKKKLTKLKNTRNKIFFSVDISKYFSEGEEITIDIPPKNISISNSYYLKHIGETVGVGSTITIDKYNPKTVRIIWKNWKGHKKCKTLSYEVFGKFIRDYTSHATKMKRGAKLDDVLNI